MRKLAALVLIAVMASACGQHVDDTTFLNKMGSQAALYEEDELIRAGRAVCKAAEAGASVDQIYGAVWMLPTEFGASLVVHAVYSYCPDYTHIFK